MLFIQLFAPTLALVLGAGALALLVSRLRPTAGAPHAALARWSRLRVLLTPSGHAFVLPRVEAAPGHGHAVRSRPTPE